MAKAKKAVVQEEFKGEGFDSPDYDPELHALWLEVVDAQDATLAAKGAEKAKKEQAGAALHKRGLAKYTANGANLWLEGKETVKAKRKGARPRGKIKRAVKGEDEPPSVDGGVRDETRGDAALQDALERRFEQGR